MDFNVRHSEHLQEVKKEKNGNKEKERISSSKLLWKTKTMKNKAEHQKRKHLQNKARFKITTNKPVSKNESNHCYILCFWHDVVNYQLTIKTL